MKIFYISVSDSNSLPAVGQWVPVGARNLDWYGVPVWVRQVSHHHILV